MAYVLLALAVLSEVGATLALRMATHGSRAWYVGVAVGYPTAFTLLSMTLARGVGIGVAYGIWVATGVALTALASRALFAEALNRTTAAGIALVIAGVLLVELGAAH